MFVHRPRPSSYARDKEIEQPYVGLHRMEQDKVAKFPKPLLFDLLYM